MANNVIQQLMVLIGGDTGGLEGALGTADKTLKEFGLSFAGIIEGMSFAALITATIEAGKTFEEASIQMQRATGATGAALDGMEENFKRLYINSAQSGEAIAGALSQIAQKTGAAGEVLESLTKSELQFAKVTGSDVKSAVDQTQKLFAQWKVATEDQSVALDMLYVATQKSGLSAEQLNSSMLAMGPTLRNVGFSLLESTALVAAFGKTGLDATDVTMGLNQAFVKFKEAGKNPKEALIELIEHMSTAQSRTEALGEAMDAGFKARVAGRFVDAVMSGAFSLDAIKKSLEDSTGAVSEMAAKTTTLGAEFTKLTRTLNSELAPAGQSMLDFGTKSVKGWKSVIDAMKDDLGLIEKLAKEHPAAAFALGLAANPFAAVTSDASKSPFRLLLDAAKNIALGGLGSAADVYQGQKSTAKPAGGTAPAEIGTLGGDGGGGGTAASTATDKVHWAKDLADSLAVLVAQEQLQIAAHRAVIQETAVFNEAMKSSIEPVDLLAINVALATESENAFAKASATLLPPLDFLGVSVGLLVDVQKALDAQLPPLTDNFAALYRPVAAVDGVMVKLGKSINDAKTSALDSSSYGKLAAAFETLHLSVNSLTGELDNKLVAAFKTVAASNVATTAQIEESWGAAGQAINKLAKQDLPSAISAYQGYIDALKRTGAAIGDIYAAQEKLLTLEIQMKQQRGVSSQAEIVQLTNIQMRQQALNITSSGLGPIYKGLMKDFDNAFTTLGNNLAAGIVQGKKFGEIWRDTLKSIEQAILTTLINAILKMAEAWIINLILGKVTASALDVGEVLGSAAVGGAAAAASTAAIPIVGPFLALGAGLAMYAAIAGTFVPLATFEHGGRVPQDMMAMVHKGEYFLPAHETAIAAAGGGSGITINFHGDFSGVTQDLVNTVMNKAITAARRAGAKV